MTLKMYKVLRKHAIYKSHLSNYQKSIPSLHQF